MQELTRECINGWGNRMMLLSLSNKKIENKKLSSSCVLKRTDLALAGVAQWIEYQPVNKESLTPVPVRAHAWVAGQVPSWGHVGGNHTLMFPFLFPSLPLCLKLNKTKSLKKKK